MRAGGRAPSVEESPLGFNSPTSSGTRNGAGDGGSIPPGDTNHFARHRMKKTADDYPDLVGFVFRHDKSFWKVTGPVRSSFGDGFSYPVIKSSKGGKEFREQNGFRAEKVIQAWRESGEPDVINTVGLKADIDAGIQDANKKRRIQFLEERIARDTAELQKLRNPG